MYLAPINYHRFFVKVFSDDRIAQKFLEDFLDVEIQEFQVRDLTKQVCLFGFLGGLGGVRNDIISK